jgi:hypothetical protein
VLRFWLDILLSWPTWVREKSVLLLLDTLCMAAFKEPTWQKIIMDRMMENYRVRRHINRSLNFTATSYY